MIDFRYPLQLRIDSSQVKYNANSTERSQNHHSKTIEACAYQANSAAFQNPTNEWRQVGLNDADPITLQLDALAVGQYPRVVSGVKDLLLAVGKVVVNIIPLKHDLSGYLTLPPLRCSLPHLESVGSGADKKLDEQVAG